jgi:CheY-like chemotaxis protein/anti-sigma regulatory factor (Ser/Thr protein kinase)
VDDLLDAARTARGTIALHRRPFELAVAVRDAVEAARPLIVARQHALEVDVAEHGLPIDGDETRIVQVVVNLLTNAARYTAPGGRLRVRARCENEEIVLRVEDSGKGIAPEDLPHMFDAFTHQRRAGTGLGLGLTIVRNMVGLHGGTVHVRSDGLGHGSTFEVRLPLFRGTLGSTADVRELASRPPSKRRVLVVDDNRDAAELLQVALRHAGHEVMVAHAPEEALAHATAFAPEVAILDVGLPEMTGHELGELLRARCSPSPRLIALTGYGRAMDHDASARAGFAAHFVKPIGLRDLLEAIDQ